MSGMAKPGLIARISNLIIINVIFIFAAIALILFYPEKGSDPDKYLPNLQTEAVRESRNIAKTFDQNLPEITEMSGLDHAADRYFQSLDYIYIESETEKAAMHHLYGVKDDLDWDFEKHKCILKNYLMDNNHPSMQPLTNLSDDGRHILCFVKPIDSLPYGLLFCAHYNKEESARSDLAYILMILFLTATLLSLMIIYLIKKDIELPLNQIITGCEQLTRGQAISIKEQGDRIIRTLISSFNGMSQNLTNKRNELEVANNKLLDSIKSLSDSEAVLTALVDYSPEAIIVTDLNNRIILHNNQAVASFGFDPDEMQGKSIDLLIPKINLENAGQASADDNIPRSQEVICICRDKRRFPALMFRTPLGNDNNRALGILHFVKDISESANYQEMILKLDRTATKGKMARDIAHEINNYLAIIQGNLELLPIFIQNENYEKLEQKALVMRETVDKITRFTEGLSRFSEENSHFAKEDLNQLIENLIAFLKPQNKYDRVIFKTDLADNIPLVAIDSGQLQLLLVNLINNATEAVEETSEKGQIEIETEYHESKNNISIRLIDNGPGIDPENQDELFSRRFSTKRDGTGMGLITSRRIVENHGGQIEYCRLEGKRTMIEFSLNPQSGINQIESERQSKIRVS